MNRRFPMILAGCFLLSALVPSASAIEIAMVPVGGEGNTIEIDPGDVILIEVMVSDWEPELLRAVQVQIDLDSLTSGSAGSLARFDTDADNDDICDPGNEPYCPTCESEDLHGVFIDSCRPDFFVADLDGIGSVDLENLRLMWAGLENHVGSPDPGSPRYAGTFVLQADSAARGTFTLALLEEGTFARNEDAEPLDQKTLLTDAIITIRTGRCCYPDGSCVDGITAGECTEPGARFDPGLTCDTPCGCQSDADCDDEDPCTRDVCEEDESCYNELRVYGDIAPCGGDGVVDLDDILALLDAFSGEPPCPDGCP